MVEDLGLIVVLLLQILFVLNRSKGLAEWALGAQRKYSMPWR